MTPHLTRTGGAIGLGSIITFVVAILNLKTAKANAAAANRNKPAPRRKQSRARRK